MPYDEKVNDNASWACCILANLLSLPPVSGPGDELDREVHEAFTTLATCPAEVRRSRMDEYGILESEYLAWDALHTIIGMVKL